MGWVARDGKPDGGLVGGRYRLVERLGSGGMSVVWRGYDEVLGRQVAVKMLAPQLAGDELFRERLRQEALAAARLSHPHITGVFDFGESALSTRLTAPYVVMELNDGESVGARLARLGALSWQDAVVVGAEVASALASAHARGVVHRDVTPANVMLTSAGAKVVDFGISALVGQRDAASDGSLLGTPAYLAPERLGGGQVSAATDVYALGLLIYRCLTARLPWPAGTTTQTLRAHLYADPEPLPPIPGLPTEVADLCRRCLAKEPADRPTAAELAHRLADLVGLPAIISPLDSEFSTESPLRNFVGNRPTETIQVRHLSPPRQSPRTARRLRAGLRIAAALHLGAVQSLGGGLFTGSGRGVPSLGAELLARGGRGDRRPVRASRHRLQAAAATLALLLAVGGNWAATREPADAGPAQAAAVGTGPTVPRPSGCKVRYQVRQDDGEDFEALLTVLNTGERVLPAWRLTFAYPGTQRLVNMPKNVGQNGRRVLLRGTGDSHLNPGKAVAISLRGAYRNSNPFPLAFKINGHRCAIELLGVTTIPPAPPTKEAAGQAKTGKKATTGHRRASPKPKITTKPPARTPEPAPDSGTPVTRTGGFSRAV